MRLEAVDSPNLQYSSHAYVGNYTHASYFLQCICIMCSNHSTSCILTLAKPYIKVCHNIHNVHEQYTSHSKMPTEFNRNIGRILRKVILLQELMVCFLVTENAPPPNCTTTRLPSHWRLTFHLHICSNHS
ncbi:hypothetical protein M758_UG235600 [Ceratodon purpureus]|nr:hypothetical protein M758_UG235600 [Ceratodon purpureus]